MKKKLSLLMLAVVCAAGLQGSNAAELQGTPSWLTNSPGDSSGSSQPTYTEAGQSQKDSSQPASSDATITAKAQQVINDAFKNLDMWMAASALYHPALRDTVNSAESTDSILGSRTYSIGNFQLESAAYMKAFVASQYMNEALDKLGSSISAATMQPIKDTVGRAIAAFTEKTALGENPSLSYKVFAGIVDSVKIVMLAPVKVAVIYAGKVGGAAAGTAGGAVAGLGAGIYRTSQKIYKINVDKSMADVVKLLPRTIGTALIGVVNTALLTAYGAAEGFIVGDTVGGNVAFKAVGSRLGLAGNTHRSLEDDLITKAQQTINDAFQSMSDWMSRDGLISMSAMDNYNIKHSQVKLAVASKYMNDALDKLGSSISAATMQPIKDTVGRAIAAFTEKTALGENASLSYKVLAGIVDSVKIVMLAPVKAAVFYGSIGAGAAAGTAGGAVAGLGAGIYRTSKAIMNQRVYNMTDVAKLLPNTIFHALRGVANTALLTAYGAAEGLSVGAVIGKNITSSLTDNPFGLAEAQDRSTKQVQDKQATEAASIPIETSATDLGGSSFEVNGANSEVNSFEVGGARSIADSITNHTSFESSQAANNANQDAIASHAMQQNNAAKGQAAEVEKENEARRLQKVRV